MSKVVFIVLLAVLSACESRETLLAPPVVEARRKAPIRTNHKGVPVYSFGDTFVYGVSPNFTEVLQMQLGNDQMLEKIRPKKSWEITSNKIGATPPRLPRTQSMDFQPLLSVNLQDENPETYWCSRGLSQPNAEPVWIRIDLPRERTIQAVRLVPRHDLQGWPEVLSIRTSLDAWHWDGALVGHRLPDLTDGEPVTLSFPERRAKQVWIVVAEYGEVERFGYCVSLAEVEVQDQDGNNVASISAGAGVTVSSTNYGYGSHRLSHENYWPLHYDLGLKLIRVAYWDSVLNWHFVEQEKGVFHIDPRADAVISETVANGIRVVLCLAYSNWLYTPEEKRMRPHQVWEIPFEEAPLPTSSPELLEGYLNFVRFMVRHFRDRIDQFEIWNEPAEAPNHGWGRSPDGSRAFSQFLKKVIPLIRLEHPGAEIWVGSNDAVTEPATREFLLDYLAQGIAPMVDVIDLQPSKQADPSSADFLEYASKLEELREAARSLGFQGDFVVEEFAWSASYPPPEQPLARNDLPVTELLKAKYMSRFVIANLGLDIAVYWNETWQDQFAWWSIGLLRNTFSADPLNPAQPEASYYTLRTLCTVFEDTQPEVKELRFITDQDLEWWTFRQADGFIVAVWIRGRAEDVSQGIAVDLEVPSERFVKVEAIDVLNGVFQQLNIVQHGKTLRVPGLLVKDYPVVIRFEKEADDGGSR